MKLARLTLALVLLAAAASPAIASPTMIRLGYSTCGSCHLSPQGGGLLTTYGKGIDVAQSLRPREYQAPDTPRRFLYDVRFVAAGQQTSDLSGQTRPGTAATYALLLRSAIALTAHNRISYTFKVTGAPIARTASATRILVPKALWEYTPKEGFGLAVGRDEMPSGIGLPDPQTFIRQNTDPGAAPYPTQAKVFIASPRFQLTPYGFAPGGDEDSQDREWGAGVLGGVDVWHGRAIVGFSALDARAPAFEHRSVGAFARLGFGRWGVLAEHELAGRTTTGPAAATTSHIAGNTQLFVAPYEWLVVSLGVDEAVSQTAAGRVNRTYRIAPGAQVRVSENLTVVASMRDAFSNAGIRHSRTFSLQLAVKTVQ